MTEVHAWPDKTLTPFDGALVTIRSKKSCADVTAAIEAKFHLGNAVIARGLFGYTGGSGLGAPVQICMSQRDKTRIDMDLPSALFPTAPQRINHITTNGSNHHDHIHRH